MIFKLDLMTITQLITTGPNENALKNMRESRIQFAVSECKAFLYEIDNWAKNAIDSMFGGGIIDASPYVNLIAKLLLIFFILLWIFLIVLYVINAKKDRDYVYYYHEDPSMYMKVFKFVAPVFILIPVICLFIGFHMGSQIQRYAQSQPIQQAKYDAAVFNNYESKPLDKNNQPGLDGISNKDIDFVHRMQSSGKATVIAYSDVESQSNVQTDRKHYYHLIVTSQPHFTLSAYHHPEKICGYIFALYGMLVSLIGMGVLQLWHSNASQKQW